MEIVKNILKSSFLNAYSSSTTPFIIIIILNFWTLKKRLKNGASLTHR